MYNTALKIINKINEFGFKAYIVGGFPRDKYLNRESIDIDICTNAKPKELKNIFQNLILSNEQYGSVTLIINDIHFEITTFRREIEYINNRIPSKFEYINDLLEDLLRRDFTINTLCIDSNGDLIDLLNAKADLDNKIIKMVGDPFIRLRQDSLRILRAIRFATTLNFKLDDDLLNSIKSCGYLLENLSYFRKKQELDKIFASTNSKYGIDLIKSCGLEKYLDISINNITYVDDLLGIWVQLDPKNYNFTKNEQQIIDKTKELLDKDILNNFNLYKYGLYISCLAGSIKNIDRTIITKKYNELPIYKSSDIELKIPEISKLFNVPVLISKQIFNKIEEEILLLNLANNKENIIEFIKKALI